MPKSSSLTRFLARVGHEALGAAIAWYSVGVCLLLLGLSSVSSTGVVAKCNRLASTLDLDRGVVLGASFLLVNVLLALYLVSTAKTSWWYSILSSFVLLIVVVTSGLAVNSLLQDALGRPRPQDFIERLFFGLYNRHVSGATAAPSSLMFLMGSLLAIGFAFGSVGFISASKTSRKITFLTLIVLTSVLGALSATLSIPQAHSKPLDLGFGLAGGMTFAIYVVILLHKLIRRPTAEISTIVLSFVAILLPLFFWYSERPEEMGRLILLLFVLALVPQVVAFLRGMGSGSHGDT